MSANASAIKGALSFLGRNSTTDNKVTATLPTARTRAALDMLAASSPEQLLKDEVNLRELAADLFNWTDEPKATKNVMRALTVALQTPGKYSHAVELTAYITALSGLLQPDRLARLFTALNDVSTAYAPARYTIQLSHKLKRLLERYPEERREKLAYSLWVESHTGRWWDLTAGGQTEIAAPDEEPAEEPGERKEVDTSRMVELFIERKLPWTVNNAADFSTIDRTESILEVLEEYNNELLDGKVVDPDTAVLASHLTWLKPLERTESPIGSLLDTLQSIMELVDYEVPEKPKTFSAIFPDIKLYGGTMFPFPNSILLTDGTQLLDNVRLEVVTNAIILGENRTYMGNCTWSYKSRMEKGEYVLYRLHHGEEIYNGSLNKRNNKWYVQELNSRFNRGNVPQNVRDAFQRFVNRLPDATMDNDQMKAIEYQDQMKKFSKNKYRYTV